LTTKNSNKNKKSYPPVAREPKVPFKTLLNNWWGFTGDKGSFAPFKTLGSKGDFVPFVPRVGAEGLLFVFINTRG
jgi:hypothetical protein